MNNDREKRISDAHPNGSSPFHAQQKTCIFALAMGIVYIFLCIWVRPTKFESHTLSLGRIGGIVNQDSNSSGVADRPASAGYKPIAPSNLNHAAYSSKSLYLGSTSDPNTLTAISYNVLHHAEHINHVVDYLILLNNMYNNDVFLLQEVEETLCIQAIRNHEVLSKLFPYQTSVPGMNSIVYKSAVKGNDRKNNFLRLYPSWDSITGDYTECNGRRVSGVIILSRYPIMSQHALIYSFTCRAALYVDVEKEKDGLRRVYHVINTHLFPMPHASHIRRNHAEELARWLRGDCSDGCNSRSPDSAICSGICKFMDSGEPLIIGGDFNIRYLEDKQELEEFQSLLNATHTVRYNDGTPTQRTPKSFNAIYGTPINPRDVIDSFNPYINDHTAVGYGYMPTVSDESTKSQIRARNVCGIRVEAGKNIPEYRGVSEFLDYILVSTQFYNADIVYNQKVITYGYGDLIKLANNATTLEALNDSLPCVWDRDLRKPGIRPHKAILGRPGIDKINRDNAFVPVEVYKHLQLWETVFVNHASDHLPVILKIRAKTSARESV